MIHAKIKCCSDIYAITTCQKDGRMSCRINLTNILKKVLEGNSICSFETLECDIKGLVLNKTTTATF